MLNNSPKPSCYSKLDFIPFIHIDIAQKNLKGRSATGVVATLDSVKINNNDDYYNDDDDNNNNNNNNNNPECIGSTVQSVFLYKNHSKRFALLDLCIRT